jgi:hypothetical protein
MKWAFHLLCTVYHRVAWQSTQIVRKTRCMSACLALPVMTIQRDQCLCHDNFAFRSALRNVCGLIPACLAICLAVIKVFIAVKFYACRARQARVRTKQTPPHLLGSIAFYGAEGRFSSLLGKATDRGFACNLRKANNFPERVPGGTTSLLPD